MRRIFTISILVLIFVALCGMFAVGQTPAIKVEALSIHKLHELGLPNPNNWDNVSSGLPLVGVGAMVYLSGWDIATGAYMPAVSPAWALTAKPAGSATMLETATDDLVNFKPDMPGVYTVSLTLGSNQTTINIRAANYTGTNIAGFEDAPLNCATCHATFILPELFATWKESDHATIFPKAMSGEMGAHWGESCMKCHSTGYSNDPLAANNGGFVSKANEVGFVWSEWAPVRTGLYDSLLTTDQKMLSFVATIGCESCHGPYVQTNHTSAQPVTMNSGVCAQCHDEPWRHNRYVQWEVSGHAEAIWSNSFRQGAASQNNSLQNCARCHDGQAYVNFTKGMTTNTTAGGYESINHTTITCQTCHDPHSAGLRKAPASSDTLSNGFNYSGFNLGSSAICFDCHKFRRDGEGYVPTNNMSSHWGPHYAGVADVLLGEGAYTFGMEINGDHAHQYIQNTCVGCHMAPTPDVDHVARDKVGMHTWELSYELDGGRFDNTAGCVSCHGPITSFDQLLGTMDYDMNGVIEPFMTEVAGLLDRLAMALPPYGSTEINRTSIATDPDSLNLKGAFFNYLFVRNGKSLGVHNPKYVIRILQASISQLTGVEFEPIEGIPAIFSLDQNYPNPFNPSTQIRFTIPEHNNVTLEVFDVTGRKVATLLNEERGAGRYTVVWDGRNASGQSVSSGMYLYRITAGSFEETKRMVFVK
jgi:hypothetical protein